MKERMENFLPDHSQQASENLIVFIEDPIFTHTLFGSESSS